MNSVQDKADLIECLRERERMLNDVKKLQRQIILYAVENEMPGIKVDWRVIEDSARGTFRMPQRIKREMEERNMAYDDKVSRM